MPLKVHSHCFTAIILYFKFPIQKLQPRKKFNMKGRKWKVIDTIEGFNRIAGHYKNFK